ncbi:MAG: FAD/NAD(P)-binding protein [Vicinamibacterales bacterium]
MATAPLPVCGLVPHPLRIAQVRRETVDTFTIALDVAGWPGGYTFAPGQFNMLYAFGMGESAISVSGDPGQPGRLVHTIRAVGTVTRALQRLRRGAAVGVRGPYGTAWPLADAEGGDLLLMAGGLGLAPLRPVVYHVLRHRARFGAVALLVGARTPEALPFRRELARWARHGDIQVRVTVDRAGADWRGAVGVVPALARDVRVSPGRARAFLCGPEVMLRFAERELSALGFDHARIFVSLERNMTCAIGHCGHCQLGPSFVCRDGPVFPYDRVRPFFLTREA